MSMLTVRESFDQFLSHLSSTGFTQSGIRSYEFSVTCALPKWLFTSSSSSLLCEFPVSCTSLDACYHRQMATPVQHFIEYAVSIPPCDIGTAISEYELSLLQNGRTRSWVGKWKSAVFFYGREIILMQTLESMGFLLPTLLSGNTVVHSRQSTGYIIKYIRYLYVHGLLKADLPWEKDENWKTKIYDILREASGITLSLSSSWNDLLLAYLDFCHHEKDLSLKSIRHEQRYLNVFSCWVRESTGKIEATQLTGALIKDYINSLLSRGLSNVSVRHHLNTIKSFAAFLLEYNIIGLNPVSGIKIKSNEKRPKAVLSLHERDLLLSVPLRLSEQPSPTPKHVYSEFFLVRDMFILHLFATTGVRLQEISELRVSDVDLDDKIITIRGKGSRNLVTKGRYLFLDHPGTFYSLSNYLKVRSILKSPWLFVTPAGMKLQPPSFQEIVSTYGKLSGINRRVNPQLLRASFASWMVEKGIDPVALKELMGHKSIRTTFGYYVFLKQEHVRKTWAECNPLSVILSRKENKQQ